MFIGEAPGWNEDQQGRPFVGAAGQFLDSLLASIKLNRQTVYIANVIKCRPPENRDPSSEEIESYKPYLARQIDIIDPKIIVPLGRFYMNYFLPFAKITRDQGKLFNVEKYFILPMLHPAAALRGNEAMKMFKETFLKLPGALGKVNSGKFGEAKPEQVQKQQKFEDVQAKLF